ncbi:MAG TPA: hypothetical protein VIJ93_04715, partial [bacterium]
MGSTPGKFSVPQGVGINLQTGAIFVADTGNSRIQHFDYMGKFINEFDFAGSSIPDFGPNAPVPTYIDVDNRGQVYVVDQANDKLYVFDSSLNFLFSSTGDPASPFNHLQGVAVEKSQDSSGNFYNHGNIYVTDLGRLQTFKMDLSILDLITPPKLFVNLSAGFAIPVPISYRITDNANVTIQLWTDQLNSTLVGTILANDPETAGTHQFVWDGKVQGTFPPSGNYLIVVTGTNAEGSVAYTATNILVEVQCYQVTGSWSGSGNGQLVAPNFIRVDSNGFVYISDSGSIKKYDACGRFITKWSAIPPFVISKDGSRLFASLSEFGSTVIFDTNGTRLSIPDGSEQANDIDNAGYL